MIEISILEHLKRELYPVPVHLERPDPEPHRFVIFEKTGSGRKNKLSSSTFAFQSYAETMYQAAVLNELVKSAVENLIVLNEIGSVKLNSDYNFTDTTTKQYRYQAVFDISHY
jgi:hypothetical protein